MVDQQVKGRKYEGGQGQSGMILPQGVGSVGYESELIKHTRGQYTIVCISWHSLGIVTANILCYECY